jgi:hypothetical protein
MKIIHIFGPKRGLEYEGIWSVEFEEGGNEFERILELWDDPVYMYQFCVRHLPDLQEAFGFAIDPETAADELMEEADSLARYLIRLATQEIVGANLQYVFKPLDNMQANITELQLSKGSYKTGMNRAPVLRIYAVRIDRNTYVVTGGAIKLSRLMKDRPHTDLQLQRLRIVRDWLRQEGIYYSEDLTDLT